MVRNHSKQPSRFRKCSNLEWTASSTGLLNPSKFRDLTEVRLVRHSDRESPTDKDEYTAVDLCSSDFIPLASWGQLGEKGPVFTCIQERFLQADLKNACCSLLYLVKSMIFDPRAFISWTHSVPKCCSIRQMATICPPMHCSSSRPARRPVAALYASKIPPSS